MEIDMEFYKKFWSNYDFAIFGEWSQSIKDEWFKAGEPYEVKPSEWEDYLEAQWEKITSNLE